MKFNTLRQVNKPIRFWGLSPLQFSVTALLTLLTIVFLVLKKLPLIFLAIILIGLFFSLRFILLKLKEKQQNAGIDYIESYFIKQSTPRKIIDRNTFKFLIK